MTQETLKPLSDFFCAIQKDARISITHIGIYASLLQYWKEQNFINPMNAFSYDIMNVAKISSPHTYYRCMKDLSEFGYIEYQSSFNRRSGSKIYITQIITH